MGGRRLRRDLGAKKTGRTKPISYKRWWIIGLTAILGVGEPPGRGPVQLFGGMSDCAAVRRASDQETPLALRVRQAAKGRPAPTASPAPARSRPIHRSPGRLRGHRFVPGRALRLSFCSVYSYGTARKKHSTASSKVTRCSKSLSRSKSYSKSLGE